MSNTKNNDILKTLLEKIELPDSAYEKAKERYQDLGNWLHRPESTCVNFAPHVLIQGSFRLGTAISPDSEEEYDLDMGCNLRHGLNKNSITQKQLKHLLGYELELYRKSRGIKKKLTEKKRCWRLEYADKLSFHMDIVPCIPESDTESSLLKQRMVENSKFDDSLAQTISQLAVSITDNTDTNYAVMSENWRISNPEGYARWFETRMKTAILTIHEREIQFKDSIDNIPYYQWKTPLQLVIQLLKRHRDTMFKNNEDSKPISIIITTLAAKSYKGESDLVSALDTILSEMDTHINPYAPLVPNPVNPAEDFADKWYDEKSTQHRLQENFYKWLYQARADFKVLCADDNVQRIIEAAQNGLDLKLDSNLIARILGVSVIPTTPTLTILASDPKPWFKQ